MTWEFCVDSFIVSMSARSRSLSMSSRSRPSPGGIYLRPEETIAIDVRNGRAESVLLGVSIIGTVIQK